MNVAGWADENLDLYGDYPALSSGGRTWSFAQLHGQACRFAGGLVRAGVKPGDRVALSLPNGGELCIAFDGVLRAGAIAVVVHDDAPAAELQRLLTHSSAVALVA